MSSDQDPWVLPLGFPLGVSYPREDGDRIYESVSFGSEIHEIGAANERAVWRLAHGVWSMETEDWGRAE